MRSSGSYSGSRTLQSDHNDEADYSEHSIPLSRSTVAAQASEKQRKAARQELDSMLAERASLSKTISHITEQLEGLRNPTATSRLKRPAPTTIPSSDATDSKEEIGTETNKKPKLEENEEDPAHSQPQNEPTRRSAKQAFQNPLMQRLLVGTLHKSQKEIERDKSDKLVRFCCSLFF